MKLKVLLSALVRLVSVGIMISGVYKESGEYTVVAFVGVYLGFEYLLIWKKK